MTAPLLPGRGRIVERVCCNPACERVFQRRACDLTRTHPDRVYCSRMCKAYMQCTGRTMWQLVCPRDGCGRSFWRQASVARQAEVNYCSAECYHLAVDRVALGRKGGAVAHLFTSPEVKRERSRKAGLARAAKCSPEKLREIAMKGVAARKAAGAAAVKKANFHRRFGKLFAFGVPLGRKVVSSD